MPRPKKSQALNSKNYRIKHAGTLKEKERLRSARRRKQQKSEATIKKEREQGRLRYQAWCARQKAAADAAVPEPDAQDAYKTKQATSRALNKARDALPRTPSRRQTILMRLVQENSLPLPKPIVRCRLPDEVIMDVTNFFLRDDISQCSPGRKEYVRVDNEPIQKRYLLMSLKEVHNLFSRESGHIVSLSKFCELRPKHVVPFGNTPVYSCCCLEHENFKSVCNALSQVTRLPAYSSDWLATVVYCNPATPRCAVGLCDVCSSSDSHRIPNPDPEVLEDGVTFRFWQRNEQSQRMEQDARAVTVDTAHKLLLALLPKFIVHERTRVHQSAAYRDRKAALAEDEQIFHFDFSENYTCAHQDATQQAYWCQNQVTIFTVAVYRKSCSIMLALVSDSTDHTKSTVSVLLSYLLRRFATPGQRVRFWSDGPASQFKNKFMFHFTELACREFELAELSWEFFATSHGKGAIDGLGGTLKRFAWCEVRTRNAIVQDAEDFVRVVEKCDIDCHLIKKCDIQQEYADRFQPALLAAPEIPGIKKLHCWVATSAAPRAVGYALSGVAETALNPVQSTRHRAPVAASSVTPSTRPETQGLPPGQPGSIAMQLTVGCWALVNYFGESFPGQVEEIKSGPEMEWKVNVMVKSGGSFVWPRRKDSIYYAAEDILTILQPPVPTDSRGHFKFSDF
uniref:Integrase catalytic domain-containing protein n=1 Tax=Macrostomum lignano TaxID=282301 RepID=A0A1I8IAX8_9PLAT